MGKRLPHAGVVRPRPTSSCFAFLPLTVNGKNWKPNLRILRAMSFFRFESVVPSPRDGYECFRVPLTEWRGYYAVLAAFSRYPITFAYGSDQYPNGSTVPVFGSGLGTEAKKRNHVKAAYDANRKTLHALTVQRDMLQLLQELGFKGLDSVESLVIDDTVLITLDGLYRSGKLFTKDGKPTSLSNYAKHLLSQTAGKDIPNGKRRRLPVDTERTLYDPAIAGLADWQMDCLYMPQWFNGSGI